MTKIATITLPVDTTCDRLFQSEALLRTHAADRPLNTPAPQTTHTPCPATVTGDARAAPVTNGSGSVREHPTGTTLGPVAPRSCATKGAKSKIPTVCTMCFATVRTTLRVYGGTLPQMVLAQWYSPKDPIYSPKPSTRPRLFGSMLTLFALMAGRFHSLPVSCARHR